MVVACLGGRGELVVFGPKQPLHEQPRFAALGGRLVAGLRRAGVPAPLPLVLLASVAPGEMAALGQSDPLPTRYRYFVDTLPGGLRRILEGSSLALNLVARSCIRLH